ncbi:DUF1289 domain-containing protein [Pseudomonas sp. zbq_18]|uniref:DUF1289 domain-containing protein n=1 Tax=Pseudomonas sp. zbq_18 TaxID=3367251 RepID=UPI00370CCEF2
MKSSNSTNSEVVGSPCRRQCCLDAQDICLGCGRTLSEILEWGKADDTRRRAICQSAQQRLRPPLNG